MLASLCVHPPLVIAADAFQSVQFLDHVDGLILSPGPGRPCCEKDMGITLDAIKEFPNKPILGVCLGHQALGHVYGANVTCAPYGPVHGQVSRICTNTTTTSPSLLWKGIPNQFDAVRYHSLVVQDLSKDLEATAWCHDGNDSKGNNNNNMVVMALQHKRHPHFGVQFHPESIGTNHGMQFLRNFCELCEQKQVSSPKSWNPLPGWKLEETTACDSKNGQEIKEKTNYKVLIHKVVLDNTVAAAPLPTRVYEELYENATHSFWLDSSSNPETRNIHKCRFSIVGASNGPLSERLEYYGKEHAIQPQGLFIYSKDNNGREKKHVSEDDILTHLQMSMSSSGIVDDVHFVSFSQDNEYKLRCVTDDPSRDDNEIMDVPFDYRGGYVGYLGYDVRHDSQRFLEKMELGPPHERSSKFSKQTDLHVPTAAFLFADRSLVYDHYQQEWYLVGVAREYASSDTVGEKREVDSVVDWMRQTQSRIRNLSTKSTATHDFATEMSRPVLEKKNQAHQMAQSVAFIPNRSHRQYQQDIATCHEKIRMGESYELCLTNQLEASIPIDFPTEKPLDLYKLLRKRNPAPFSALFNLNAQSNDASATAALAICCSSPERFVSVKRQKEKLAINGATNESGTTANVSFQVESKPIKGTIARQTIPPHRTSTVSEQHEDARRALELSRSVKDRAENLMIVDLLRNDLNRVCRVGTVHVPKLMDIESYATLHQMVSTIRGTLAEDKTAVDVLIACFPGGSMTGAPKLRTVEILEDLELGVSRGPYSGCLGYISLNGSMDMNIVIRTACLVPNDDEWKVCIGAGGAITALSESEDEYEEMRLKARAVMEAVESWANGEKADVSTSSESSMTNSISQ